MQEKALNEAMGSLRRVADLITSTSTEPQEPVRESLPKTKIKQVAIVAPRTPKPTTGGHSGAQCTNGDGTVFPAQDVRFKQGKLKSKDEATPAGDRLQTEEQEEHIVHAGAVASPIAPYPYQMGVMCLPLCYK